MIIIDRIEEGIAVCEDGEERFALPVSELPEAKEGDVLVRGENGWQVDEAETERRREQMIARMRARRRRPPKDGD